MLVIQVRGRLLLLLLRGALELRARRVHHIQIERELLASRLLLRAELGDCIGALILLLRGVRFIVLRALGGLILELLAGLEGFRNLVQVRIQVERCPCLAASKGRGNAVLGCPFGRDQVLRVIPF